MKIGKNNKTSSAGRKTASEIRVNPKLDGRKIAKAFSEAAFFQDKMKKGAKILSIAGLPK